MSLAKPIKMFLHYCAVERQLSENTLQAYGYDLADFGKRSPKGGKCNSITTEILREYLEDMMTERSLSAGTVRRRIACLRSFFRYLEQEGKATDPFIGWRLKLPRRKRLPRALSRVETGMLLARKVTVKPRKATKARTFPDVEIRLMVSTGIRVGELCKLWTSDVSHDGSSLRIRGKGSRDRMVYVTDVDLRIALQKLVTFRQRVLGGPGPLFTNRWGTELRPQSFRSRLRIAASEAGLGRKVTPHMLRHTAATLLIETGVDIRIVQRLLGHSSIATTEIYTHVSDEALRKSLERANVLGVIAA
jgi:integrase/recombinase XerD